MRFQTELPALWDALAAFDIGLCLARQAGATLELVYANQAFGDLCAYPPASLIGRDFTFLCPAHATLAEVQQFQNLACPVDCSSTRLRCQRQDGQVFWAELQLQRRHFKFQGQAVHCLGLLRDISTEVDASLALHTAYSQLQLLLDSIASPVLGLASNMDIKFCNRAYAEFVGAQVGELQQRNLLELFPEFRKRRSYAAYQQVLATGQPQALEGRMGERYLHIVVYPSPWGILVLSEDYTERRKFEDELINRDRLLLGFAQASALLTSGARDSRLINLALAELGKSAQVDQVYLWESASAGRGPSQRYEWRRESLADQPGHGRLADENIAERLPRWYQSFQRGLPVYGLARHFPAEERELLEAHGILAALIVPIMIQRRLWGLIGFNSYSNPREWRQSEIGVLLAAAASLGSAIAHQDAEARLLHERGFLQQVIDSIPDLVFYKNLDSVYMGCNRAFTRFAGVPKDSVIGHSDIELFPAELAGTLFDRDRLALAGRSQRHDEEWASFPDGRHVLLDTLRVPFTDTLGSTIGVLGVSRDITEKRRTERVQREFVDNVSHELRTPITALVGLAETLQRSDLTADQRQQLLARLESQALRLARLADDILSLSNLELAQQTIRRDRIDLRQVCHNAFEQLAASAADKPLNYQFEPGPEPAELLGDGVLLELLVANLLSNAIRYTPAGGQVKLWVQLTPTQACAKVADTGIGIAAEQQERIFDRFYRVDKGRSRAEGGTGLGLAIVNQVLELHHGEIKVESQPGLGSVFTACFPRLFDPAAYPPPGAV